MTWRMDEDESTAQTNGTVRCRDVRLRLSSPAFSQFALLTSARLIQVPAPAMTQHKEPREYSDQMRQDPLMTLQKESTAMTSSEMLRTT